MLKAEKEDKLIKGSLMLKNSRFNLIKKKIIYMPSNFLLKFIDLRNW